MAAEKQSFSRTVKKPSATVEGLLGAWADRVLAVLGHRSRAAREDVR